MGSGASRWPRKRSYGVRAPSPAASEGLCLISEDWFGLSKPGQSESGFMFPSGKKEPLPSVPGGRGGSAALGAAVRVLGAQLPFCSPRGKGAPGAACVSLGNGFINLN